MTEQSLGKAGFATPFQGFVFLKCYQKKITEVLRYVDTNENKFKKRERERERGL